MFEKVRNLARSENPDHPWLALNNEALMRSAGLFRTDFATGEEGYTLAAVLLLGKDEVIQSVVPSYRTDALVRVIDIDRFDDREIIQTNLIESYEHLMAFIQKHLPSGFAMDRGQRLSLRDNIFREVVANLLVHREFTSGHIAKLVIQKDRVVTDNWSLPKFTGVIIPDTCSAVPELFSML